MSKKYRTTQELANGFPDWSKVRTDEQSVGQGLLNVIGKNLDVIQTELHRGFKNTSLTTTNVAEIDLVYRFQLPQSFAFEVDNPTQLEPIPLAPTVSGLIDSVWYEVEEAVTGSIKEFWYEAIPSRIEYGLVTSGINHWILDDNSENFSFTTLNPYFQSNQLSVEVTGDSLFAESDNQDGYLQARVRITGTTWKDTEEVEEMAYIFAERKLSTKVFREVTKVEAVDFPASGNILIHSHQFNMDYYIDPFENISQYSHSRDNFTTFWSVGESCWIPGQNLLEVQTYAVSDAFDVLRNRTEKYPVREWELVDSNNNTIQPIDIAPIPFSDRAWAITDSGLFLYTLDFDQPSQKALQGRTNSPLAQIVTQRDYVTRDEEVEVDLRFVRPLKTVIKHRLTIKFPDGTSMGVLEDGSMVATSTDYYLASQREQRSLRRPIDFVLTELGDHVLTLEVDYQDGTTEIDKRMIRVASKSPLVEFNLTDTIGVLISGVDLNHQQELLVVDVDQDVHLIIPHYDTMLIDYDGKEIVFHENYTTVKVTK